MYKLYCSVLNSRLVEWTEANKQIDDSQNGFRSDRSCIDQISSLTSITETRKQMKKPTMALFVDFSKAFDTDTTEELQTMLNIIHSWCQCWAMSVNSKKNKLCILDHVLLLRQITHSPLVVRSLMCLSSINI